MQFDLKRASPRIDFWFRAVFEISVHRHGMSAKDLHGVRFLQDGDGPDGEGSTYGPALVKTLKTMPYDEYVKTVTKGRETPRRVMLPFEGNKNVMCYLDEIYIYLKSRSDGVLPRGRPPGRDEKPQAAKDHDRACFGG